MLWPVLHIFRGIRGQYPQSAPLLPSQELYSRSRSVGVSAIRASSCRYADVFPYTFSVFRLPRGEACFQGVSHFPVIRDKAPTYPKLFMILYIYAQTVWPIQRQNLVQCQWCDLRPSVLGQDRSETKKIGLGLAGLLQVLCCETRSCHARRHNDLEGHGNFSSTVYSFSIRTCLEHHYRGDQQWRSLT